MKLSEQIALIGWAFDSRDSRRGSVRAMVDRAEELESQLDRLHAAAGEAHDAMMRCSPSSEMRLIAERLNARMLEIFAESK